MQQKLLAGKDDDYEIHSDDNDGAVGDDDVDYNDDAGDDLPI